MKKKITAYCQGIPVLEKVTTPKDKVAVIRMSGVIADAGPRRRGGISFARYEKIIEKAFDLSGLKAVAFVINSPGGAPAQCALISAQIRRLAEKKEVPVYAFVEDVAASGGYWLACAADHIFVQGSSIVGSIGVISAGFGLDDFIKRYDIKRRVYTSGKDKSFLDPFVPEKAKDIERLKGLQAEMHEQFKDWVKERRGERLNGKDAELMEGGFWTGTDALEKGLVDGLGDVRSVLQDQYGEDIKFADLSLEKKWMPSFLPFGGEAQSQKEDWLQAALDAAEDKAAWSRFGL